MKALLIIGWVVLVAAMLLWPQLPMAAPGFNARFVALPPSISLETYIAASKASARPSYCMWTGPDRACRVS
jgi:hypothetical protein